MKIEILRYEALIPMSRPSGGIGLSAINDYFLGRPNCNKENPETGKIEKNYPDEIAHELEMAHQTFSTSQYRTVEFVLYSDGTIDIARTRND